MVNLTRTRRTLRTIRRRWREIAIVGMAIGSGLGSSKLAEHMLGNERYRNVMQEHVEKMEWMRHHKNSKLHEINNREMLEVFSPVDRADLKKLLENVTQKIEKKELLRIYQRNFGDFEGNSSRMRRNINNATLPELLDLLTPEQDAAMEKYYQKYRDQFEGFALEYMRTTAIQDAKMKERMTRLDVGLLGVPYGLAVLGTLLLWMKGMPKNTRR